jgi:hypothetical protein
MSTLPICVYPPIRKLFVNRGGLPVVDVREGAHVAESHPVFVAKTYCPNWNLRSTNIPDFDTPLTFYELPYADKNVSNSSAIEGLLPK